MSEFNPYAPPSASEGLLPIGTTLGGVWRDGEILVMHKRAELPDRCMRCNQPANGDRLRRKLSWHKPQWYLLILISLWIYLIVALCVREKATIQAGICQAHRRKRRTGIILAWLCFFGAIVPIVIGADNHDMTWLISVGSLMIVLSGVLGLVYSNFVGTKKIDAHYVWLKKVCPEYLAQLPAVPGSSV